MLTKEAKKEMAELKKQKKATTDRHKLIDLDAKIESIENNQMSTSELAALRKDIEKSHLDVDKKIAKEKSEKLGKRLAEKALLADLTISSWNGSITDKKTTNEILDNKSANRDRGRFTKKLFMDITPLKTITRRMYHEYRSKTAAWEEGRRLLPVEFFEYLTKLHRDCSDELETALEEFGKNYDQYKEEAKKSITGLGDLYNEEEFPTFDEFKRKWKIRLDFFPIPEKNHFILKAEKNLIDEMKSSFEQSMSSKEDVAVQELKDRVFESIGKIVERLSDKKIHFSKKGKEIMNPIRELVDVLPTLNLFDDKNIAKMIDDLKKNLYEVTDEDLKQDKKRKAILKNTKELLEKMADYA